MHRHNNVISLLHEAEMEAERIVALSRMAVAVSLAVFFLVTVRPPEGFEQPVIIRMSTLALATMLSYFLLGLSTWVLVRHRRFRRWMTVPTALLDSGFVLLSIVTNMWNTNLDGYAVFAFPATWLIPLVLSFGILRGDPRAMAASVIAILAGLAGLASHGTGIGASGSDAPVRLFLAGPANIMRIFMITLAGMILVLAAWRHRALLQRSIDATLRNANLTRYLPAALAPQLAAGQLTDLRRGRREQLAVLFVDIRGFTRMTEAMTEHELSEFVTDFRHRVAVTTAAHNGMIDKFIGDAAMVIFSEPGAPARAARNALACAVALDEAMVQWARERVERGEPPVRAGIGVHFGSVFAGVVGDDSRLEYSVFGDTVNVAARLEQLTKELDRPVLASEAVTTAAGVLGWSKVSRQRVRGREGAITIMTPQRGVAA